MKPKKKKTKIHKKKQILEKDIKEAEKEFSRELEKDFGRFFEGCGKTFGYLLTICISIFLFILLNSYYRDIPFLTKDILKWLPYFNVSIFINIIGNIVLTVISYTLVRKTVQIAIDIANLTSLITLFCIFPFDFTHIANFEWLRAVVKIGLLVVIIITTISLFIRMVKIIASPLRTSCDKGEK